MQACLDGFIFIMPALRLPTDFEYLTRVCLIHAQVAELVFVLSDPVFFREQCSLGSAQIWGDAQRRRLSCGRGWGEKPPIFLTFAHAKTLFGNRGNKSPKQVKYFI